MSNEAVHWAMDRAPMLRTEKGKPDTTSRHVLQALAEHAHKDGSNAHPSVLRIQYRTGYDRRTVQRALRRLEDAKLISRDGMVQDRIKWQLAMSLTRPASDWEEIERAEEAEREATAARVRKHRQAKRVTDSASVTESDVTDSASVSNALELRYVTDSASVCNARSAALTTNQPSVQPPVTKNSSSPAAQTDAPAPSVAAISPTLAKGGPQQDHYLEAFGAFWLTYPKKKSREEAKKAWVAAIERGADPQHIVDAAQGYARERAGEDPKFTKHPATWLNKGCYDDEPDTLGKPQLRAVSGDGYRPFQLPKNVDYSKGF
ncbi:helix-turn-helix domain-containing protein [Streptomyces flavidovirens]